MGCWYRPNIILGTSGNDLITGTDGKDIVFAGSGDDVIQTGDGNDKIFAGRGDDQIDAGSGNDIVFAGSGDDTVNAGDGNDIVKGGSGDDTIDGGAGCDALFGQSGNDTIMGGDDNDLIFGGHGNDVMNGGAGYDLVIGGRGDDTGQGGAGSDLVFLGSGNDTGVYDISLNTGSWDVYKGGSGIDTLVIKTSVDELNSLGITEQDILDRFNAYAPGWVTFADLGFDLMAKQFENIMLMGGPKAVDDMVNVSEDGPALTIDVLDNDTDIGGGALSIVSVDDSGVTGGGVVSFTAGDVSFDPAGAYESLSVGESVVETLTYTIEDADANQDTATVSVTITGENDGPTVSDIALTTDEDTVSGITLFAGDDIDSEDNQGTLTYNIVNGPMKGSVINNNDGTFTFDPGEDFQTLNDGEMEDVTFTYTATDAQGAVSAEATATVTVTGDSSPITWSGEAIDVGGGNFVTFDVGDLESIAFFNNDESNGRDFVLGEDTLVYGMVATDDMGTVSTADDTSYWIQFAILGASGNGSEDIPFGTSSSAGIKIFDTPLIFEVAEFTPGTIAGEFESWSNLTLGDTSGHLTYRIIETGGVVTSESFGTVPVQGDPNAMPPTLDIPDVVGLHQDQFNPVVDIVLVGNADFGANIGSAFEVPNTTDDPWLTIDLF